MIFFYSSNTKIQERWVVWFHESKRLNWWGAWLWLTNFSMQYLSWTNLMLNQICNQVVLKAGWRLPPHHSPGDNHDCACMENCRKMIYSDLISGAAALERRLVSPLWLAFSYVICHGPERKATTITMGGYSRAQDNTHWDCTSHCTCTRTTRLG